MPLEIIIGDILKQKSDILVMPAAPRIGPSSEFAKKIYNTAGFDEMYKARMEIGHLSNGEVAVTPGFKLNAKYVIHAFTPKWHGGFMHETKFLTNCYKNAVKIAINLNVKSISFPLLGAGTNRVNPYVAKKVAVDAITGYLRANSCPINVYLVIHPDMETELFAPEHSEKKIKFDKSRFINRMNNEIQNITKFADSIRCNKSTIDRIMNEQTKYPQKNTVLLIALGLGLSKDERYDFINCSGHPYPFDQRDYRLEELLDNGYTNIDDINIILYQENPEWILTNKCKNDVIPE